MVGKGSYIHSERDTQPERESVVELNCSQACLQESKSHTSARVSVCTSSGVNHLTFSAVDISSH